MRIVEAADEARRGLERDLHEGPQQHLLALLLKLRVARPLAGEGSELAGLLEDAIDGAMDADVSLRELARGLYPVILSERGLAAAVQGLAVRAAFPVSLRGLPEPPLPADDRVDRVPRRRRGARGAPPGAADATEAFVLLAEDGDRLTVEVRDDGVRRRPPPRSAVADRVAAAGGRLAVDSPPGAGTVVRAEIPLDALTSGREQRGVGAQRGLPAEVRVEHVGVALDLAARRRGRSCPAIDFPS